jgi:uncharacterized phage protein gp47/JayE
MYENVTFEVLLKRMLDRVKSTMDKREGSVIHDSTAPAAVEFQNAYIALDTVLDETFADTASLYYLKKRAAERGITQIMASNAILKGEFSPAEVNIPVGTRFSCDTLNYVITEKISDGVYKLMCETAGTEGNARFGTLIPIDHVHGLWTAELTELLIPARDDETVEELRERYLANLTSQAYGGNIADYKEKVLSIDGVGGVKVTPVWNGGGTVKLTIIDNTFGVPSEELVENVKNAADPYPNEGMGYGFAPIGHIVTVDGVEKVTVNIVTEITYEDDWSWADAGSNIVKVIDDYFKELSKSWDSTNNLIVRISQIESRILDCTGVIDISGTKLNGSSSNLVLDANKIPVRGTVNGK